MFNLLSCCSWTFNIKSVETTWLSTKVPTLVSPVAAPVAVPGSVSTRERTSAMERTPNLQPPGYEGWYIILSLISSLLFHGDSSNPKDEPPSLRAEKGWLRSNNRWYGLIYHVLLCCLNPHHRKRILDDTGISFLEYGVTSNKCPHMESKSLHRQKTWSKGWFFSWCGLGLAWDIDHVGHGQ